MTTPIEPPEGYSFIASELEPQLFNTPVGSTSYQWPSNAPHFVLLHDECGAFISAALVGVHDTWHASLGG